MSKAHTQAAKPEAATPTGAHSTVLLAGRPFRRAQDDVQDNDLSGREQSRYDTSFSPDNPNLGHNLGRISILPLRAAGIQPKLKINEPHDSYEQEADRVADTVMRMPEPNIKRKAPCPAASSCEEEEKVVQTKALEITQVQRQADELPEEKEKNKEGDETTVQTKEAASQTPEHNSNLETQVTALRGGGQPLPDHVRSFFEPRFGHDFSKVRVHHDAQANESARGIHAQAFTVEHNIVFGAGRYAPETEQGRRLIAHELTHAMQQSRVSAALTERSAIARGGRAYEAETNWKAAHISRAPLKNQVSLQRKPAQPESKAAGFSAELDSDFEQIISLLDQFHYSNSDEELVIGILDKWGRRSVDEGGAIKSQRYLDDIFSRLTRKTKRTGVVTEEITSYYSLIFNHFDKVDQVRRIRDTYSTNFKKDEGISEVSATEQLKEGGWKKTAEEFWSAKFKNMGEELKRAGTPEAVQNLLGGVVGVIQGFAELAIELVEGIWSMAEALKNVQDALLHIVMGAAQELGFGFLQKVPLIGRLFNPETYKAGFDNTANFFQAAKGALQDPGKVWESVKSAAVQAWNEVMLEYGQADQFNKSRIIARGVVKVGMAIGGAIKDLPKLARSAGKVLSKLSQLAVKAVKVIAEALKGAIRIGKKIFKGAWKVVREMLEDGSNRLRYFFKRAGAAAADEIPAEEAAPFIKCNTCKITPKGEALENIADQPSRETLEHFEEAQGKVDWRARKEEWANELPVRTNTRPPGAIAPPSPSASKKKRVQWLRQRLQQHMEQAIERFKVEGLTEPELRAVGDIPAPGRVHPGLGKPFEGSRIDKFMKASVAQDPDLAQVLAAPDYFAEPDFIDALSTEWFDATTKAQWTKHLKSYAQKFGKGHGVFYR